jgi:hypothetical protein
MLLGGNKIVKSVEDWKGANGRESVRWITETKRIGSGRLNAETFKLACSASRTNQEAQAAAQGYVGTASTVCRVRRA